MVIGNVIQKLSNIYRKLVPETTANYFLKIIRLTDIFTRIVTLAINFVIPSLLFPTVCGGGNAGALQQIRLRASRPSTQWNSGRR